MSTTETSLLLGIDPNVPLIAGDAATFRENFNRASFAFAHNLAGSPLFDLPRLLELSRLMPPEDIFYNAGDVRVDQKSSETSHGKMTAAELIDRIENSGAWIAIKRAHRDPAYAALLDRCMGELRVLVGDHMPAKIKKKDCYIFITSPNRTTPFHVDRECNFLMQIRGDKTISLFSKYDREVLSEAALERFWSVDKEVVAYKPEIQQRATEYRLTPGVGVHIPVNAPHWVQNGDNISVTVAATFQFLDSAAKDIYRSNFVLRKLGMNPTPPGQSRWKDTLKAAAMGSLVKTSKILRGRFRD